MLLSQSKDDHSARLKPFVDMIGKSRLITPYTTHNARPTLSIVNMTTERSSTDRVRQLFTTCGRAAPDVSNPAAKPSRSIID